MLSDPLPTTASHPNPRVPLLLLLSGIAAFILSAIRPAGYFNWFAETVPAMVGGLLMTATFRRFPLTTLAYTLAWVFAIILMIGGHYSYADVPIGNWARDTFELSRNHFDRIGHVMQGVIPAMFARELLLRTSPLKPGKWLFWICTSVALAVSAAYELFEWRYAVHFGGQAADAFLGSQGDVWDAQKDMFMALVGAIVSQLLLFRMHDRQIEALTPRSGR